MSQVAITKCSTDVLIIGGGIAGVFAAVNAAQQGVRVVIADKGKVGLSGMTVWADTFCVFDGTAGHRAEDWHEAVSVNGDYINNRDYLDMMITDSAARWNAFPNLSVPIAPHSTRSFHLAAESVIIMSR